ncbi:Putative restriction endonuclease type II, DUF820 [Desulfonema limicola]|uniref:Restriction endonuclease type II, DUF820 n=1 Tax=Desulfonema limicola TaxID=45656 RepID=A0A975B4B3_9BACT|nr:Uma2 family endonuclease [Desulfonema limicola]QTA78550.1 Putative restriction endonuclease type II, DUF820 [Desulfonema limicola]
MESTQTMPQVSSSILKGYLPSDISAEDEYCEFSEDGRAVSEEEYWEKYYEHPYFSYEWNNGYLEVKPLTTYDGVNLNLWFSDLLRNFLKINRIAKVITYEFAFRLHGNKVNSIRKPDIGVVLNNNPVPLLSRNQSYAGICDMCIEVLSYSSLKEVVRDIIEKKREYERTGVKEYYILDDRKLETAFYRLNKAGVYESIKPFKDGIIQSQVLPGFQFRISDLYTLPPDIEMVKHDVYKPFIMTHYQAERQKAEQERQRAEQERQRAEQEKRKAEQEKQRAEMLAAKLRELGVSVGDINNV